MAKTVPVKDEARLHGRAEIFKYIFYFADSMALKCAVELRIADIIHSNGHPMTLSQIASKIDSSTLNIEYLERIMRMLVRMKIFTSTTDQSDQHGGDHHILYGLTPSSRYLLNDDAEGASLVPFLRFEIQPLTFAPWHQLSRAVKEGEYGFKIAYGQEFFEMTSANPEQNKLFNDAMQCLTKDIMQAIISIYGEGFSNIGSLVDVGGGTGQAIAEIVETFPNIKGINFDLPHVVATAPEYNGVSHVAGDMFKAVPTAEAIMIKHVFHNWGDEDCVKVLKNCQKSIEGKNGKVIIVDTVVKEEADGIFGNTDVALDLLMLALTSGGKERTELQWKKLLEAGGFPKYKIIELPTHASIIEAYIE